LKIPITKRAGRVIQGEGLEFKPQYQKKKKKGWDMTQVVQPLSGKHEALSSNSSTTKKNNNNNNKNCLLLAINLI
jgi:hypothetical protein